MIFPSCSFNREFPESLRISYKELDYELMISIARRNRECNLLRGFCLCLKSSYKEALTVVFRALGWYMPYIYYWFMTLYNSLSFFLRLLGNNLLCVHWEPRKVPWLPAEVMKIIKPLKLIIALSVGFSFLAIIILSYCSSTFKLRRLDGNYTGKKTLHLLAFKNAHGIPSSINERLRDSNEHMNTALIKEGGPQYPAILTSWLYGKRTLFSCGTQWGIPRGQDSDILDTDL